MIDHVGLLDVHRSAALEGLNGIFSVRRMVGGHIDEGVASIVEQQVRVIRVVGAPEGLTKRSGALDIDIHAAPDHLAPPLLEIVGDGAVREVAAANDSDPSLGIPVSRNRDNRERVEYVLHVVLRTYLHPCSWDPIKLYVA
jgi:hypothetical protein